MPKTSINYSNTIIYKICCKDPTITDIYVGHTTNLTKRRYQHKEACNNQIIRAYNTYVYQFIRDNGGWDNWDVIMIEEYNLNNENEAVKKERWWIEELKATLNKSMPARTKEEKNEINKNYHKNWYVNNKEHNYDNVKKWRENNKEKIICECGSIYSCRDKARHIKTKKHKLYISLNNIQND